MAVSGDVIANLVLQQFDKLPQKRKPRNRSNGLREWIPLCGIVAQDGDSLQCIALSTGMKCLPASKVPESNGLVLLDWHAEVLTIRALNRFLLEECSALALTGAQNSTYLRCRNEEEITETHFQPFTLRETVTLHMYCSEAPCGDASMELIIAAQDDPTPWEFHTPLDNAACLPPSSPDSSVFIPGRAYFSALGIVRRKPSRPDAPPTLSKSCSDKLSLKQCTSLLSSITSLFVSPEHAYLKTLVLPRSQYSATACKRAFGDAANDNGDDDKVAGRMRSVKGMRWKGTGYRFEPFKIVTTSHEFAFSRRCDSLSGQNLVPSNLSAIWTAATSSGASGVEESLIGGVIQGRKAFPSHSSPSRRLDSRAASRVSRMKTWQLAASIAGALFMPPSPLSQSIPQNGKAITRALVSGITASHPTAMKTTCSTYTYRNVKESDLLTGRRVVKEEIIRRCLKGWVRNDRQGEEFTIVDI